MFGENTLELWSNVYFIALFVAAIAGVISLAAGFIQYKINNGIMGRMELNVAKAQEGAAIANLKAAEVEKQNIELRKKIANRRITSEQHKILVEEMSKQPSTFNIETMGDTESGLFAADILKTFEDAGWKVDRKEFPLGVVWHGLILFKTDDPAALVIADALNKANIVFKIGDEMRQKATIMVGGKPPVF